MSQRKGGETTGFIWAYRDLLTAMMIVFMALGLLAVIAAQKIKMVEGVQPGQMLIQMSWTPGSKSDIDLWIQTPDDMPVGYMRSAGKNCDLLRDDLGLGLDATSHAIELMVCRDPLPGEYIINVMNYNVHPIPPPRTGPDIVEFPMPVTVTITRPDHKNHSMKTLFTKEVIIDHLGQEITVVRFTLDSEGNIVPGSINDMPHMIRTHQDE